MKLSQHHRLVIKIYRQGARCTIASPEILLTEFITRAPLLSIAVALAILLCALQSDAAAATQDNWRGCGKCRVMFYNGFPKKGRCIADGEGHSAESKNFILAYAVPETPTAQAAWRFCTRCNALFFDGYSQKGSCPVGGGHIAQGYMFVLPHDVPPRGVVQPQWRYCDKCHAMFYNGTQDKGVCAAGGAHRAAGYNFLLRYRGNF